MFGIPTKMTLQKLYKIIDRNSEDGALLTISCRYNPGFGVFPDIPCYFAEPSTDHSWGTFAECGIQIELGGDRPIAKEDFLDHLNELMRTFGSDAGVLISFPNAYRYTQYPDDTAYSVDSSWTLKASDIDWNVFEAFDGIVTQHSREGIHKIHVGI